MKFNLAHLRQVKTAGDLYELLQHHAQVLPGAGLKLMYGESTELNCDSVLIASGGVAESADGDLFPAVMLDPAPVAFGDEATIDEVLNVLKDAPREAPVLVVSDHDSLEPVFSAHLSVATNMIILTTVEWVISSTDEVLALLAKQSRLGTATASGATVH
jgi:hypothetical protein